MTETIHVMMYRYLTRKTFYFRIQVLNILGFICIMVSEVNYHSRANWFNFVAMGGFWITGILLAFYLFHIIEKLHFIPWIMLVGFPLHTFDVVEWGILFSFLTLNDIRFITGNGVLCCVVFL